MESSWKQSDVFPIIARIIGEEFRGTHGFVTSAVIAARLQNDAEAEPLLREALLQSKNLSIEQLASNMVAWFSARITAGSSDWAEAYQRKKMDNHWSYMPIEEYQITPEKADQLLRFLPQFSAPDSQFVKRWTKLVVQPPDWLVLPYPEYCDEVVEFFRLAGQPCWDDFDYVTEEASRMLQDTEFVKRASLDAIKTMLTFCVRGEKFSDGHWEQVLRSGYIVNLLTRLKCIRESMSNFNDSYWI